MYTNLIVFSGPGNCIGLLAAKSCPTGVRGHFYGIAAAIGKLGAFVGTWGEYMMSNCTVSTGLWLHLFLVFPPIIDGMFVHAADFRTCQEPSLLSE